MSNAKQLDNIFNRWVKNIEDFLNKPTLNELVVFSKQMYSLTKAGVPIMRSIKVLVENVKSKGLKKALNDIVSRLDSGQSLATSVNKHPTVFPGLVQSLINVGENTGDLDEVFRQTAMYLEREYETKKRIKSAMRYPMIVIATIFVAVGIINILVVPTFASFFSKFNADLPLPTKILIASSKFTLEYWNIILIGIIAMIIACIKYINTKSGRFNWDRYKLKIPLVGSIIQKSLLSRFARSFSLTTRTGVPLLEAIDVIAKTTDNEYVSKHILGMRQGIERGESLTTAAKNSGMFSTLVMQMMHIGEETGEIDKLLDEVADFYERELEYDLKKLSESIEPILIVIVAIMVLVLALGVFLPMWDLASVALGK